MSSSAHEIAVTRPDLAFFAAWAMQRRRGPRARRIVEQALTLTQQLPSHLRDKQISDILSLLHPKLGLAIKEKLMKDKKTKALVAPWVRKWQQELRAEDRAEGKMEGELKAKREALMAVLRARGMRIPREDQARIKTCERAATLDRWIEKAANAESVREVLGSRRVVLRRVEARATAPYTKRIKRNARTAGARPTKRSSAHAVGARPTTRSGARAKRTGAGS